jgi:hypothetical protein
MKKETLFWLTIGLGVGLVVSASLTYRFYSDDRRKKEDPRLERAEALLEEAESLLRTARKGKTVKA